MFTWECISSQPTPTLFPSRHLHPRSPGRLVVLLQARQQLPEALLARPRRPTLGAFPAEVHQLDDALPARAAGARVLAAGQEGLGLAARLRDRPLLLGVVVFVEVVDGALRGLDRFFLLGHRRVGAVRECEVAAFAPFPAMRGLANWSGRPRAGEATDLMTSGSSS